MFYYYFDIQGEIDELRSQYKQDSEKRELRARIREVNKPVIVKNEHDRTDFLPFPILLGRA